MNNELIMTSKTTGLTSEQAEEKILKHGKNEIKKSKKINPFVAFLQQFIDPMVILLIIAAVISLSLAIFEQVKSHKSLSEIIVSYIEPGIIMLVIILNSMLGAYQVIKSDQAVRALEKLNKTNTKVLRDGEIKIIPSELLTVGDIVIFESGDNITADCRIIEANNLMVVEASLTGENLSVEKRAKWDKEDDTLLANNDHLLYSGTYVTNGRTIAQVIAIGTETQIGSINKMVQKEKPNPTPLQIKLNKLSKIFGYLGIALLFVSFFIQIALNGFGTNFNIYTNALVTGISLSVAAIPEGLITFTTVILSIGITKMSKENALIKNLLAVETLGSTSIICSDKTGTLTENKMTIVDLFANNILLSNNENKVNDNHLELVKLATLCNDGSITVTESEIKEVGDPTETGILRFAHSLGLNKTELETLYPRIGSLPFDSDRKLMSVLIKKDNQNIMIVKGAPDILIKKCKNVDEQLINEVNEKWANSTYRVLALAKKVVNKASIDFKDEKDLEFVGLLAMVDPPRAEVSSSIYEAMSAGIKVVMITGDHINTAKAIATQLGFFNPETDLAITGAELSQMSDQELNEKVKNISVYARVNPEDKLRIVKAWQNNEKVVSMTGDGVNDAPALKASDIGCAMGITGTDVSKQAADMILVDDNFATIVKAVRSGRLIYDKVKTVIQNLLISSLTEILLILLGMLLFFPIFRNYFANGEFYVFSASQLLWINLLTHGLPAIALGFVDSEKNVMLRKPYDKKESIFARGMGIEIIWQSSFLTIISLISYIIAANYAINNFIDVLPFASTATFVTMGLASGINSINLMSDKSIFRCSIKKYYWVWIASLSSAFFILLVAFVPAIAKFFRMSELFTTNHTIPLISVALGLSLIVANEIKKLGVSAFAKAA
ncbi:cation-translocating P-type ATPase [Mycoplasmopsis hyopharyngis]|uniref:cation-translocating P-type ATPase n=1 Tax=Mycoplasmopsis hyopharyngis TaxID=29558 RepID=UPI003873A9EA